jgi:recombinational DNA repair protein (RecF pathway)
LTGLSAGSAKHSFIIARLEQIQAYHEQLASLVGETRAAQLVIELAEALPPEENPSG